MTDIKILDKSYTDDSMFFHRSQKTILRKIDEKNAFFRNSVIKKLLIDNNVVDYKISRYDGKEYLEVQPFFFPNSAANWSYSMYKDWIYLYEKLYKALQGEGLTLIDGHCFNFVFYFGCLKFVDLGSIQQGSNISGYKEFKKYKKALFSYRISSAPYTRHRLDSELESPEYLDIVRDIVAKESFASRKGKIKRLFGLYVPTAWRNYYGHSPENYADALKEEVVKRILKSLKPETVYDIGCNTGYYSLIAESFGGNVVACDPDPDCVDYLYNRVKVDKLRILPLVANVDGFLRAIERTYENLRPKKVDAVFMLALIHHLVYEAGYNFEEVFDKVHQMGAKSLILEFVSKKDKNVQNWDQKDPKDWYTLDHLCDVGRKYFANFEIYDKHDSERPIIFFDGEPK